MVRVTVLLSIIALLGFTGCAKQLSPEEIAKLEGGTTKVVVYGFCVPMDHIIKTTLTRATLTFAINGKTVGSMLSCGHATFNVPSGYWKGSYVSSLGIFPRPLPYLTFHPGKTQYLYMAPGGNGTFDARWVSKAELEQGIAAIKNIKQIF